MADIDNETLYPNVPAPLGTFRVIGWAPNLSDPLNNVTLASLPVSTATQTALDAKLGTATAASTYATISGNITLPFSASGLTIGTGLLTITGLTSPGAGNKIVESVTGPTIGGGYLTTQGGAAWRRNYGTTVFTAATGAYAGQSEVDPTTSWGYNLSAGGSPNTDLTWLHGMEARYLDGQSNITSEAYYAWQSPLSGSDYYNRRPAQVNMHHGDTGNVAEKYQCDWLFQCETFQVIASTTRTANTTGGTNSGDHHFRFLAHDGDPRVETTARLSVGGAGVFGGSITSNGTATNSFGGTIDVGGTNAVRVGVGNAAPARLEHVAGGQQGLTLYNSGLTKYTRYHTGLTGSSGAYIDCIGQANAPDSLTFRQSSNDGTTMTTRAQLHAAGRWTFGASGDDGVNMLQVVGSASITGAIATTGSITTTESANNAFVRATSASSNAQVVINSQSVGNQRSIRFSHGATPTLLWDIGSVGFFPSTALAFINSQIGGGMWLSANNNLNIANLNTDISGTYGLRVAGTTASTTTATGAFICGGGAGIAGRLTANVVKTNGFTVATLPAGTVGDRAYVTDATAPTYLGALTGGGAITCPVFFNGSAWVSA